MVLAWLFMPVSVFCLQKFMNMFKETHSQASLPMMPPPELGSMLSELFDIEDHPR